MGEVERHAELVDAVEVGDEERGKVEPHALGVEKAQAAVVSVQVGRADQTPVVLLVLHAASRACRLVIVAVHAVGLGQADAAAEGNAGERSQNLFTDFGYIRSLGRIHLCPLFRCSSR
ncbi:MAG: hypothetical protein BWX47_00638 [candidate division Hyd24-12 bacterium ADurb.Bin004]|nr:MAG: hypothetical protein BWX47_00638 [candidate division Hyd24-12 bacterium ADurb.Bin004]